MWILVCTSPHSGILYAHGKAVVNCMWIPVCTSPSHSDMIYAQGKAVVNCMWIPVCKCTTPHSGILYAQGKAVVNCLWILSARSLRHPPHTCARCGIGASAIKAQGPIVQKKCCQ
jgi:hypothetical protein